MLPQPLNSSEQPQRGRSRTVSESRNTSRGVRKARQRTISTMSSESARSRGYSSHSVVDGFRARQTSSGSVVSINPGYEGVLTAEDMSALVEEATERNEKRWISRKNVFLVASIGLVGVAAFAAGYLSAPQAVYNSGPGLGTADSPEEQLYAMVETSTVLANSAIISDMNQLAGALEAFQSSGTVPLGTSREFFMLLSEIAPPKEEPSSNLRRLLSNHDPTETFGQYFNLATEINNDRQLQASAKNAVNNVANYIKAGVENIAGSIVAGDDVAAVVKSGTDCYILAKETNSAGDWWNNLQVGIIDVLNVQKTAGGSYGSSIRGFKGFAEGYNRMRLSIWGQINSKCSGASSYNFGGYSRGGGIVTIAAAALVREGRLSAEKVRLITYGSPRALSKSDADYFHGRTAMQLRITYKGDPVPSLPYGWMGAKHAGYHRCYSCSYSAGRDKPGFGWPTNVGHHLQYDSKVFPVGSISTAKSHLNT